MEGKGRRAARPGAPAEAPQAQDGPVEEAAAPVPRAQSEGPATEPGLPALPPAEAEAVGAAEAAGEDMLAVVAGSQAAFARGLQDLGSEMTQLAQSGLDNAAHAASALLGAKTLADAITVNAGFAGRSFETLLAGSARLSELAVKLAIETTLPLLGRFGKGRTETARAGG